MLTSYGFKYSNLISWYRWHLVVVKWSTSVDIIILSSALHTSSFRFNIQNLTKMSVSIPFDHTPYIKYSKIRENFHRYICSSRKNVIYLLCGVPFKPFLIRCIHIFSAYFIHRITFGNMKVETISSYSMVQWLV